MTDRIYKKIEILEFRINELDGEIEEIKQEIEECPKNERNKLLSIAVKNNNIDAAKFLIENSAYIINKQEILCSVVKNNNIDMIKLLHSTHEPLTLIFAAEYGNLEIVKYLHEAGVVIRSDALTYAVRNGHLNVVEYLVTSGGVNVSSDTLIYSVERGHLELVKFFLSKETNDKLYRLALIYARNDEIKKYLYDHIKPTFFERLKALLK